MIEIFTKMFMEKFDYDTFTVYELNEDNFNTFNLLIKQFSFEKIKNMSINSNPNTATDEDYFNETVKSAIRELPVFIIKFQRNHFKTVEYFYIMIKLNLQSEIEFIDVSNKEFLASFPSEGDFRPLTISKIINGSDIVLGANSKFKFCYSNEYGFFKNLSTYIEPKFFDLKNTQKRSIEFNYSIIESISPALINKNKDFTKYVLSLSLTYDNKIVNEQFFNINDVDLTDKYGKIYKRPSLNRDLYKYMSDFFMPYNTDLSPYQPLHFEKELTSDYIQNFDKFIRPLVEIDKI